MRVFCYFNLHKKCFSLKALEGPQRGRVIAHAEGVHLSAVEFRVSQAGRARVLLERRKNVHAGVVGQLTEYLGVGERATTTWTKRRKRFERAAEPVTYNPYLYDSFVSRNTGEAVREARECLLQGRNALALA